MSIEDELEDEESEDEEEVKVKKEPQWKKILFADTADKPIGNYRTHALNYDNKDSTGRIIRGFEGMIGNLDKAIIDVGVGIIQKISEFFKRDKSVQ